MDKSSRTGCASAGMCGILIDRQTSVRILIEYFAANYGSSKQVSSHSQSVGGVSESESFVIRSIEERAGEIDDMVKDYLLFVTDDNGTPLLYRGCSR